ncbi:hypothetical protein [Pseudomonas sp. UBA6562]|uniref:hypothetical protein n=1 Tax=Pseudomonas sp. UBA6562 TaxID=1947332 RepID=UPI0025F03DC6|nr:hypothetical protein [Pseudomonas sp. UBA6562]
MTEAATAGEVVLYDARGEIRMRGYMSQFEAELNAKRTGFSYLFARASESEQYVNAGKIVSRPKMALQLVGLTLKGVPADAVLIIEGIEYISDGSDIELGFSLPGEYEVVIDLWPYQSEVLHVENRTQK